MWVLVIGPEGVKEKKDGSVASLIELGCRVETADLWDYFDEEKLHRRPPTVIIIEAIDEVEAGRAALSRVKEVQAFRDIPVILSVSVQSLSRIKPEDYFDDFVLHPIVPAELYMRIRWADWKKSDFSSHELIKIGPMAIDLAGHEVTLDGSPVQLTQQEFALLKFLCQGRGRVFTRDQLLERVWGVDYYGSTRTVDIHIRRLRMKLGNVLDDLETVRGVGYKMRAP